MQTITGKRRFSLTLFAILIAACSGKNFQDMGQGKDEESTKSQLNEANSLNNEDSQNLEANLEPPIDEPIMTGGAFLSCQVTTDENSEDMTSVGCRFEENGERIAPPESYVVTLSVWYQDTDTSELISSTSQNENFDWIFSIDVESLEDIRIGATVHDQVTGLISEFRAKIEGASDPTDTVTKITLSAYKSYRPKDEQEASHTFAQATAVSIPSRIEVTMGNAGSNRAELYFDTLKCEYMGGSAEKSPMSKRNEDEIRKGMYYNFEKCTTYNAGDTVTATNLQLRIHDGDRYAPTKVMVDIPIISEND